MQQLDFVRKDYSILQGTRVKFKTIQYSAIGIALVFCIKEIFLRAEHGRR